MFRKRLAHGDIGFRSPYHFPGSEHGIRGAGLLTTADVVVFRQELRLYKREDKHGSL